MRYTRQQHLRTQADFMEIRASGKKWECGFFYVNFLDRPTRLPAIRRAGFIASRRVGDAVRRNRAKRLMRELFRRNQGLLPESCDVVLVARPGIVKRKYSELEPRFRKTIQKRMQQEP